MSKNKNMDKASERKRMMKKLIALLFLPLFLACQKEVAPEDDYVTVSFLPQIESGNILTRSQFSDEVLDNLKYGYPHSIELRGIQNYNLTLEEGKTYSIQKGTYNIKCGNDGRKESGCWSNSLSCIPLKNAENQIIVSEDGIILIPLKICGFIISCKKSEASYFRWGNMNGSEIASWDNTYKNLFETSSYYYYIISLAGKDCNNSGQKIAIQLGETESNEITTFYCYSNTSEVVGKYFIYSPNPKDLKTFDFTVNQGWNSGNDGNEN